MRRAELSNTALVVIIISLMVLAFVGTLVFMVQSSAKDQLEKTLCKASVGVELEFENVGPNIEIDPFALYCPRKVLVVQDEKIDQIHYEFLEKFSSPTDYGVMYIEQREEMPKLLDKIPDQDREVNTARLFAYEMAECWDTFLQGRKIVTDNIIGESEQWCMICAQIDFEDRFAPFTLDLDAHLQSSPVHILGEDVSYEQYLYTTQFPSHSARCKESFHNISSLEISSQEDYVIALERKGSEIAGAFGNDVCQGVGVIPISELHTQCSVVVN